MHENASMHEIWVMASPCIFQNLFIIIILMQMIISQTKDFAQTNGYL